MGRKRVQHPFVLVTSWGVRYSTAPSFSMSQISDREPARPMYGFFQNYFKRIATLSSKKLHSRAHRAIERECSVGCHHSPSVPSVPSIPSIPSTPGLLSSPAQPWTTQLWDLTGFSYEDLIPCVLSLHKKW